LFLFEKRLSGGFCPTRVLGTVITLLFPERQLATISVFFSPGFNPSIGLKDTFPGPLPARYLMQRVNIQYPLAARPPEPSSSVGPPRPPARHRIFPRAIYRPGCTPVPTSSLYPQVLPSLESGERDLLIGSPQANVGWSPLQLPVFFAFKLRLPPQASLPLSSSAGPCSRLRPLPVLM